MSARQAAPRAFMAGLVALILAAGALGAIPPGTARADSAPLDPANPATPITVTADALPTVQINGVAWSQVVVGNTVYVAGQFDRARPAGAAPGTQETVRNNLLAYDIRTGQLITSFAPSLNAQAIVLTASPDGSRLYVGGDFTVADGQPRNRVAAYSTASGQLVPDFRPSMSGRVGAIAATGGTVYLGGTFTAVGSVGRHRLAAVSASNGALLPWAPVPGVGPTDGNRNGSTATSDVVRALVVTNGGAQVVAAGHFDTLNGQKATGVGALDAVSGQTRPFAVNQLITNQGVNSAVYSLSTDGTNVYGTAYDYYGPGNLEGSFSAKPEGGTVNWFNDCHGDSYSSFPMGGALYMAGHPHVCSNIGGFPEQNPRVHRYGTALSLVATGTVGSVTLRNGLLRGQPAPSLLPWFPTMTPGSYTGQYQAGWSVTGNDQYVVYGGEFPRVNGTPQQGLVRYALPSIAPNRVGPPWGELAPTVSSPAGGMVRVGWLSTDDRDNEHVTYRVYRDGDMTTPVHESTRSSLWWITQHLGFIDLDVPPGTHTYRVSARDAAGNQVNSPWVSVEVAQGTVAQRDYSDEVRADGADRYWPMGEPSGSTAYDHAGAGDLSVQPGLLGATPVLGESGAITGDADTSYRFRGQEGSSGLGHLATTTPVTAPNTFTLEAWFQTTSAAGGKIIGFGNATAGSSTSYDRHVYMDASGKITFGVYPEERRTVTSTAAYNDGRWHHVAASMSSAGMVLYVDGVLVGSRTDTTRARQYDGYWRVGGDTSWSDAGYFAGRIDEAAVYPTALPADRIAAHHALGATGEPANRAPTASFTTAVSELTVSFDAGASADSDGSVASYAWDFGDGSTGSGATVSHTYAAAGTYPVTLTVTDDDGATGQASGSVTVSGPAENVAPTASFTTAVSELTASFDAGASADSDGSVASYAWDFGDGSTGSGATVSHTYAAAGTYPVTLTVADDDGATATATGSVTVTDGEGPFAADAFERAVTGGWGTADVGGDWSIGGAVANASVSGGAGQLTAAAGRTMRAVLAGVSQQDAAVQADVLLPEATTGGGTFVSLGAQRVDRSDYHGTLGMRADGSMFLRIDRAVDGVQTVLAATELALRHVPGEAVTVRFETSGAGTGSTTLQAKVWAAGTAEPANWILSTTDSTAALQRPGAILVETYTSGSATRPSVVRIDDLRAVGAPTP